MEGRLGSHTNYAKTLDCTTQLCESPVEMDREKHQDNTEKRKVQALHPNRIERTDSDTFLVHQISQGYACI
jgi:hypothetical protein